MTNTDNPKYSLCEKRDEIVLQIPQITRNISGNTYEEEYHGHHVHPIDLINQNRDLKKINLNLDNKPNNYIDPYDLASFGYFSLTEDGRIAEVNRTGAIMFGMSRHDLTTQKFRNFIFQQDLELWDQFFLSTLQNKLQKNCEIKLLRQNGEDFFAKISGARVDSTDGSSQIHIVISDVTELIQTRQNLQKNRDLLHVSQEIAQIGCWEYNIVTKTIWGSAQALAIFGFPPVEKELPIDVIISCIPERDLIRQAYIYLLSRGSEYNIEFLIHPVDGSGPRIIHSQARLEKSSTSSNIRISGIIKDITRRNEAETMLLIKNQELQAAFIDISATENKLQGTFNTLSSQEATIRDNEERLLMTQEIGHIGCWEYYPYLNQVWFSAEAHRIYGFTPIAGTISLDLVRACVQNSEPIRQVFLDFIAGKCDYDVEFSINPADGSSKRVVHSKARLEKDREGRLKKVIGVIADISKQKELEIRNNEAIHQIQKNLAQLAVLNDEIRNPLTIISLCSDKITDYQLEDLINDQVKRIDDMVNQLDTRWIESNKVLNVIRKHYQIDITPEKRSLFTHQSQNQVTEKSLKKPILEARTKQLYILNKIVSLALTICDPSKYLSQVLDEILRFLDFDVGCIYLGTCSAGLDNIICSQNIPSELLSEIHAVSIDKTPYDALFAENDLVFSDYLEQKNPELFLEYGFKSAAVIPIMSKTGYIGVLTIASTSRCIISDEEKLILTPISYELGCIIERLIIGEEAEKPTKNYENLFNSVNEMIFVVDMQGYIVSVNDTVLKRLAYSSEDIIGIPISMVHDQDHHYEFNCIIEEIIAGTRNSCQIPVLIHDNENIEVDATITRGWWNNQEVLIWVSRDVSERKHLRQEIKCHGQALTQLSESLILANNKLTLLSSITRHDICNQLTVLIGYLEIIRNMNQDTSSTEYFMKVKTVINRISSMILFTKEYEQIGINSPLWQNCRSLVKNVEGLVPLGQIQVINDLPTEAEIYADPLITKVFYNLMDNAVRYSGTSNVIRFCLQETNDETLLICKDDGVGIPDIDKGSIFDKGFGKNTGFGLYLSREILDITGLSIRETGSFGDGACFEIQIPVGKFRSHPGN